jgi:hypothetical protein
VDFEAWCIDWGEPELLCRQEKRREEKRREEKRREVWIDERPHLLMPIAKSPLVWREHLYHTEVSGTEDQPSGLRCYRSHRL